MTLSNAQKKKFQNHIFDWWKEHKRNLPWRHTHDPYKVFVSEILLQQTQVSRGLPKYLEFITQYPTLESLAMAKIADVLRLWKGMGYNRRAVYMVKTAKKIVEEYGGKFPEHEDELIQLPGLGRYTARAILVFSFKKDIAMIDTNIRQILLHFFFHDTPQPEKEIQALANQLLPIGLSWEWHQALMDYGALALQRKKTQKRKQTPFKESNRFIRGRVLDLLREKNRSLRSVIQKTSRLYGKDKKTIKNILIQLQKDGLITISETGIISLPE